MSQIVDIGLSFYFIVCRRWKLENKYKKSQKLAVFCHKIETKAETKYLRQISLDRNVPYTHSRVGACKWNIKRDIHVQKIKVKKKSYKFAIIKLSRITLCVLHH